MMKILEIGPGPKRSKGGMAAVIKNIQEDEELNSKFEINTHESYTDGGIIKRFFFSIFAYLNFLCIYKKYDIFHIHVASYGSTFRKGYYVRFLKKRDKQVILHIHGGEYLIFLNRLSEKKKKIVYDIWEKSDCIIVLSDDWKKKFEKIFHHKNIIVIQNGIDTDKFKTGYCDVERCCKKFLMLGRLGKGKGVYDIIEAVKMIMSSYPDLKVYMAGDGEVEQVKEKVKLEKLDDQIEILGWVDFDKKIEVMKNSATILLPSYNEGLPITLLEGMAAGKVIISTYVGAIPELITDNENGILINPGDVNALSNAMIKIMQDIIFDKKCSENNIRKIQQNYNKKIMHKKINAIFTEMNNQYGIE